MNILGASVELVQKMLKNRVRPCRVDFKDLGGLTALHYASIRAYLDNLN